MWTYLFVYSDDLGPEERIRRFVDQHPEIVNWYRCLPNSLFIVSTLAAQDLAREIRKGLGEGRFIVVDTNSDRSGWLPRQLWALMSNPRPVGA